MVERFDLNLVLEHAKRMLAVGCGAGLVGVVLLMINQYVLDNQFEIIGGASDSALGAIGFVLIITLAMVAGPLRRSEAGIRALIVVLVSLLALFNWLHGAAALPFVPLLMLVGILMVPASKRVITGLGLAALFTLVTLNSPTQIFPELQLRSLVLLWVLVWPVAILFSPSLTLDERKIEALKSLLLLGGLAGVAISILRPDALHGLAGTAMALGIWFWLRRSGSLGLKSRLLLVAMALLGLLNNLHSGGSLSIPLLSIYIIFAFVLFATLQGAMAASLFTLLAIYGQLLWGDAAYLNYVLSSLIGTFIFMLTLFTYMVRSERLSQGRHSGYPLKTLAANFLISLFVIFPIYLVLYLPLDQLLHAGLLSDRTRFGWLAMSILLALLGSWLLTVFLVSRQQQIEANRSLKELNEELKQQRAQFELQRQRQEQLFSAIGDELNKPLTQLNTLLERVAPFALGRERADIQASMRHLKQVVEDLNLAATTDAKRVEGHESIRPGDLIRISARALTPVLQTQGVSLDLDIDPESRLVCEANPKVLRQVVGVLLRNVAQHSKASKAIVSVNASRQNGRLALTLRVQDNGLDVSVTQRDLLFKSFYQASAESTGLGLGLSIARSAIEAEGGSISYFHSELGGAGFEAKLELNLGRQSEPPESQAMARGMRGLKVLLVDDNQHLILLTSAMLEKAGAQVTLAANGEEALQHVLAGRVFDLVLTDIFMPVMDGYDLARELRQRGFGRVILGVTAASIGRERERILEAGADDCLFKPLSVAAIENAYQRAIAL